MTDTILERDIAGASLRLTECQLALEEINAEADDPIAVRCAVLTASQAAHEARQHLINLYRAYMRTAGAGPMLMIQSQSNTPA